MFQLSYFITNTRHTISWWPLWIVWEHQGLFNNFDRFEFQLVQKFKLKALKNKFVKCWFNFDSLFFLFELNLSLHIRNYAHFSISHQRFILCWRTKTRCSNWFRILSAGVIRLDSHFAKRSKVCLNASSLIFSFINVLT